MKKKIVTLMVMFLLLPLFVEAALVANWEMDVQDGKILDLTDNGHHATLSGSPVPVPGRVSSALRFNGQSGRLAQIPALTPAEFSIEALFRVKVTSSDKITYEGPYALLDNSDYIQKKGYYLGGGISQSDKSAIGFRIMDKEFFTADTFLTNDQWHHLVFTVYSSVYATTVKLYVDGQQVGNNLLLTEGRIDGKIPASSYETILGNGFKKAGRFVDIDYIKFYDNALTATEVTQKKTDVTNSPSTGKLLITSSANVEIKEGTALLGTTNTQGKLTTAALAVGPHTLTLTKSSYKTVTKTVSVVGSSGAGTPITLDYCTDNDGDTYGTGPGCQENDCEGDNNQNIKPGVAEVCGNNIDENCDGKKPLCANGNACTTPGMCQSGKCVTNVCCATAGRDYYKDADGDGYGISTDKKLLCQADTANKYTATQGGDCDDTVATITSSKDFYKDADGDSYGVTSDKKNLCAADQTNKYTVTDTARLNDCNDNSLDPFAQIIHPNAQEICGDGKDFDCNGQNSPCTSCIPIPDGLNNWWPGENNVQDLTERSHGGLVSNYLAFAPGKRGLGFYFDRRSYNRLGEPDGYTTISFWVKTTTPTGVLISSWKEVTHWEQGAYRTNFEDSFLVSLVNGILSITDSVGVYSTGRNIADGQFHHITIVSKSTALGGTFMYVDGQQVLQKILTPRLGAERGTFYVAGHPPGDSGVITGVIDEVLFFNRPFTASEITDLYTKSICKPECTVGKCIGTTPYLCERWKYVQKQPCRQGETCTQGNCICPTPLQWFYYDGDGDTYGIETNEKPRQELCVADTANKYTATQAGDCDDARLEVNPNSAEICGNDIDENCDSQKPFCPDGDTCNDNIQCTTQCRLIPISYGICCAHELQNYYKDIDGDGFGGNDGVLLCQANDQYTVTQTGDCDDSINTVKPGATEVCDDGIDNDCTGGDAPCKGTLTIAESAGLTITEGATVLGTTPVAALPLDPRSHTLRFTKEGYNPVTKTVTITAGQTTPLTVPYCTDNDNDKYGTGEGCLGHDCNDNVATLTTEKYYYYDDDGDGYGIETTEKSKELLCDQDPSRKYVALQAGDCDDSTAAVKPTAQEICGNDVDENCDNQKPLCANGEACTAPGMCGSGNCIAQVCCATTGALYFKDADQDGVLGSLEQQCLSEDKTDLPVMRLGDCNDNNPARHFYAEEICGNGIDEDCDGTDLSCPTGKGYGETCTLGSECKSNSCVGGTCCGTSGFEYYYDADGDGFYTAGAAKQTLCKKDSVNKYTATQAGDCNDNDGTLNVCPQGKTCVNQRCELPNIVCTGLVAEYLFDESSIASGISDTALSNTGTKQGTGTIDHIPSGVRGKAAQFKGSAYYDIGNNDRLQLGSGEKGLTIEAWVKPHTGNMEGTVVSRYHHSGGGLDDDAYHLALAYQKVLFQLSGGSFIPSYQEKDSSATALGTDEYHQVVITYNQKELKFYVDKVLLKTESLVGKLYVTTGNVFIGATLDGGSPGRFLKNTNVDEVRLYDVALTQKQIEQNYEAVKNKEVTPCSSSTSSTTGSAVKELHIRETLSTIIHDVVQILKESITGSFWRWFTGAVVDTPSTATQQPLLLKKGWNMFSVQTAMTLMVRYDDESLDLDNAISDGLIPNTVYTPRGESYVESTITKDTLFEPNKKYILEVKDDLQLVAYAAVSDPQLPTSADVSAALNDPQSAVRCTLTDAGNNVIRFWKKGDKSKMILRTSIFKFAWVSYILGDNSYNNAEFEISEIKDPSEEIIMGKTQTCNWIIRDKSTDYGNTAYSIEDIQSLIADPTVNLRCFSGGVDDQTFTISGKVCTEDEFLEDIQ